MSLFKKKENIAELPKNYENYVFDLYGTLVDIRTDEGDEKLWDKLALFYGYYNANYSGSEIRESYMRLCGSAETKLKNELDNSPKYAHESNPEIDIVGVFRSLFTEKGVEPSDELVIHAGQLFRVFSTEYVKVYPGTEKMLSDLKQAGKKVYLLSNAQRIFTAFEMNEIKIAKYFDDILISSDYQTKKPDKRFFDALIEKHEIDPSKTLFVGNDSTTDIKGAISVGFDTFYVNSNISPKNDSAPDATYSVDSFIGWN